MINVTLGEVKTKEKPFPKLMVNQNGCVRLVFRNKSSLIINSVVGEDSAFTIYNVGDWDETPFTDYNEPITLQNA